MEWDGNGERGSGSAGEEKQVPPFGAPGPWALGWDSGQGPPPLRPLSGMRGLWEHQLGTGRHLLFKNGGDPSAPLGGDRGPLSRYFDAMAPSPSVEIGRSGE